MRFLLCGSYPNSGGWGDYMYEFATEHEAKLAAVDLLKKGCSAYLEDKKLGTYIECRLKPGSFK